MHRKFIAFIISAAMAVTAFTAPARADGQDVAKVLAGIAALAIIGKVINDHNDNKTVTRNVYQTPPRYQPVPPRYQPVPPRYQPGPPRYVTPRPVPPAVSRFNLPGHCLRAYPVNRRTLRLFDAGCLQRSYSHARSLPYACQYQFSDRRGSHTGYEPVCLRERGYRIAG